jgi:hypothetical protein
MGREDYTLLTVKERGQARHFVVHPLRDFQDFRSRHPNFLLS